MPGQLQLAGQRLRRDTGAGGGDITAAADARLEETTTSESAAGRMRAGRLGSYRAVTPALGPGRADARPGPGLRALCSLLWTAQALLFRRRQDTLSSITVTPSQPP